MGCTGPSAAEIDAETRGYVRKTDGLLQHLVQGIRAAGSDPAAIVPTSDEDAQEWLRDSGRCMIRYELRVQNDTVTRTFCALITGLLKLIDRDALHDLLGGRGVAWWEEHQRQDAAHLERDAAQRRHQAEEAANMDLARAARDKLTAPEYAALLRYHTRI